MYDENNDEDNNQVEQLASRMPTSQQWEMAARNSQMAEQHAFLNTLKNEQGAVYNDLRTMKQAVNQRLAQQTLRMQYASASLMKEANGGTCTPQDIQWWNSQTGAGGKNKGAVLQAAGYDDNGNFNMVFVDPTTKAQSVFTASQLDQYQMANNMPGIFSDQDRSDMHNALLSSGHSDQELSKYSSQLNVIGGANLTTGEISSFGGRPGPRPRFTSEDDLNGTPYKDENAPGRRYLGHGVSSFSTADWQEDREEKREPNGRWVETAVGPSDTFDGKTDKTQVRTYKNTKTGEVVRVKDGETPPWRKNSGNDRLAVEQMRQDNMNHRAEQRSKEKDKAFELKTKELEERTKKRLQEANTAEERRKAIEDAKKAELDLRREEIEAKWTQMGLDSYGDAKEKAQKKVADKLKSKPTEEGGGKEQGKGDTGTVGSQQQQGGSGAQGKPAAKREKIKGEVSKDEYESKVGSGHYKGHILHDNSGAHYVIDGKKMVEGSSFSIEEADDFDRLIEKYDFKFSGNTDPNDKEKREIYENLKRREAKESDAVGKGGDKATIKSGDNTNHEPTLEELKAERERRKKAASGK